MMGEVLAKLARLGHRVQVVIATDGKDGTRDTRIPAGDELGRLRRRESECACARLGIEPPIFLSIERLDTKIGVRAYLEGRKRLLAALEGELTALHPDAVLTFGPDGEYGHSEHIVVGAVITDLLLRHGWVEKHPLYYFAATKEQVADDDELAYLSRRYLDAVVRYTDEDERRSLDAARCYVTQTTAEEIEELVTRETADSSNVAYFRRLQVRPAEGALESLSGDP
jgi:LmbE family N-acetylglucosaminyl deacetylase